MTTKRGTAIGSGLDWIGKRLAAKLAKPRSATYPFTPCNIEALSNTLIPGDVLLVEGNQRVSTAIKYLTQSTWSHAALFAGAIHGQDFGSGSHWLVEVNLGEGCVAAPLSKYACYNTRICRPVGLTPDERATVVGFMLDRLGLKYDLRNVLDLARYFFPTPPVPMRWRRRMLALGSGDPTRAICSSLIAQAFQAIHYPILPKVSVHLDPSHAAAREIYHIRHHSLFAPRDFDLSPFFEVVKPTLTTDFDFRSLIWADTPHAQPDSSTV